MKRLLPLLLLLCSVSLHAEEIRTFDLQHRSAAEIIPVLKPMLDQGSAISGTGYTLIIRSSEKNLDQLEAIIKRLDQAPKMLLISVIQGGEKENRDYGASVSGSTVDQSTQIRLHSTRREGSHTGGQQLQVLEGHWATIRAGQAIPQVTRRYQQTPGGTSIEQSIDYRDVDTGFEVRPRVRGETVTLEIRPFRATPSERGAGTIEQQEIITTVNARLGEWIELGGVAEKQKSHGQGILYTTGKRGELTRNVKIRVDLIAP